PYFANTAEGAASTALAPAIAITFTSQARESSMTSTTAAAPADLSSYPLIPREALFGNPLRASGQISPDGKWLSWLAPKDGVLNLWMAPASDPSAAKA